MKDRLPGGRAAGRPSSEFDPVQLKRGCKVELEHTPDWTTACEIARDHLVEDRDYYKKLATIHLDGGSKSRRDVTKNWIRGRQFDPKLCARGSFRMKKIGKGKMLVICCPKGEWMPRSKRCRVGTRAQSILKPRKRR